MAPIKSEFIAENKKFKFQMGQTVASALSGFIAGAIVASIIWWVAVYIVK